VVHTKKSVKTVIRNDGKRRRAVVDRNEKEVRGGSHWDMETFTKERGILHSAVRGREVEPTTTLLKLPGKKNRATIR